MNKPFRITIEHWDNKYVIEKDHSDLMFDEYMEMLRSLTVLIYSKEQWNKYFEEDGN